MDQEQSSPTTTPSSHADDDNASPKADCSQRAQLESAIKELHALNQEDAFSKHMELQRIREVNAQLQVRLNSIQRTIDGRIPLSTYATLLRDVKPGGHIHPSYVVRLQAQVCKVIHHMGIIEDQIELLRETSMEVTKGLKKDIADIVDQKCEIETDLMSQIVNLEHQIQVAQEGHTQKLEQNANKLAQLEQLRSKRLVEGTCTVKMTSQPPSKTQAEAEMDQNEVLNMEKLDLKLRKSLTINETEDRVNDRAHLPTLPVEHGEKTTTTTTIEDGNHDITSSSTNQIMSCSDVRNQSSSCSNSPTAFLPVAFASESVL